MEGRKKAKGPTLSLCIWLWKCALLPPGTMQLPRASQAQDPPLVEKEKKALPSRAREYSSASIKNLIEPNQEELVGVEKGVRFQK